MTAVRIPPLAGGQARIRLVYQDNPALQVMGFEGPEWSTTYTDVDLTTEAVVDLTPTADIATNDGSATCYAVTATTTGRRGWSCCVQVPDSHIVQELADLVGASAIDPASLTAEVIRAMVAVDRLHDFVSPYSYCGIAPEGTLTSVAEWDVTRIELSAEGAVIATLSASPIAWDDRLTAVYS